MGNTESISQVVRRHNGAITVAGNSRTSRKIDELLQQALKDILSAWAARKAEEQDKYEEARDRARAAIEEVLILDEQRAQAWYLRAWTTELPEKQRQCLERALSIDPSHLGARKQLRAVVEAQCQQVESSLLNLRGQHKRLESEIARLSRQQDTLQSTIAQAEPKRQQMETSLGDLQARLAATKADLNDLAERQRVARAENQKLWTEHVHLEQAGRNLESKRLERGKEVRALDLQIAGKNREIVALDSRISVLQQEIKELDLRAEHIRQKLPLREAERDQMQGQISDLQREQERLKKEDRKRQEERQQWQQTAANLQSKIRRREQKLAELEAQIDDKGKLQQELEETLPQVELLRSERQRLEQALEDLHNRLEQTKNEVACLHTQRYWPSWQELFRSDLDRGVKPLHARLLLRELGRGAPAAAQELELEIAARTECSEAPMMSTEPVYGLSRLFAGVIRSRAAMQKGDPARAVQVLCDGWDTVLAAPHPESEVTSPESLPASASASEPHSGPDVEQKLALQKPASVQISERPDIAAALEVYTPPFSIVVDALYTTLTLQVGASCILVDPGPEYVIPDEPPDLAIVTHAHHDHTGQLIPLCERFPDLPIIMTPETSELLSLSSDAWKRIQERQVYCLEFDRLDQLPGVDISLRRAGHILGAAMADLATSGRRILVTGDFSMRSVGGLPGAWLPTEAYDLALMEAVHASDPDFPGPSSWDNRDERLVRHILRAIGQECTRILIISDAIGDAQEVYDALLEARQERYASALGDYDIYLGGHAGRVARLYARAGAWQGMVPDAGEQFPPNSIVIASRGEAEQRSQSLAYLRGVAVFESKPNQSGSHDIRSRPCRVDLHASLPELMEFGQQITCNAIGLYHNSATRGSELERHLLDCGKRIWHITNCGGLSIDLKEV